jgi:hypothetical protein
MSKEIFIVFIINGRYSRWEIFNEKTTISDIFILLKNKYQIEKCIVEIKELFLHEKSKCLLIDISPDGGSIYISTKDTNYVLKKDVV